MAALTRRESEERQAAVLKFFMENPRATGEEMQKLLTAGRLTGKKGPPMGQGMLYKLKDQALEMLGRGARAPEPGPLRGESASLVADEQLKDIRDRARELQKMLSDMNGSVLEIHISRDGLRVTRLQKTDETL